MAELPLEHIFIQPLANGVRVDVISGLDPTKPPFRISNHFPDRATAEEFAQMLAKNTGFPIVHAAAEEGRLNG